MSGGTIKQMNEKNVSQKGDFGRGLRAGLPAVLGYIPVGIAYAIAARQAGLGIWQTCSLSLFVYAGASQMMAVEMLVREAGIASIIIATFILNLRHIIMSSCIFSCMRPSKALPKVLSSFWATDESFAIFTTGAQGRKTLPYFVGLAGGMYASWNISTIVGAFATSFLPDIVTASFGIALYAMFIGLLVPGLKHNVRLLILVLFTAVVNTFLSKVMPSEWALIVSTLACAAIGAFFVSPDAGEKEVSDEH